MELTLHTQNNTYQVDMPDVTTVKYAAKRCASVLGLDEDMPFLLVDYYSGNRLDDDMIVADLDNVNVLLGLPQ